MSRNLIFKKMKKDSCAGNSVSDLGNQNSFVWIQISFVRNPSGNGIVKELHVIPTPVILTMYTRYESDSVLRCL